MKKAIICLLQILLIQFSAKADYVSDGTAYIPVIVFVLIEGRGHTAGADVQLLDAGENDEVGIMTTGSVEEIIQKNLSKPVQTDRNSTAVVWMRSRFSTSSDGKASQRVIRGRLIVGPRNFPYLDESLDKLIPDLSVAKAESGPIFLIVTLNRQKTREAQIKAEQAGK